VVGTGEAMEWCSVGSVCWRALRWDEHSIDRELSSVVSSAVR
jgi:hypothetical protein